MKILRMPLRLRYGALRMTAKLDDQTFRLHIQTQESTNKRCHSEQARMRSAGRCEESERIVRQSKIVRERGGALRFFAVFYPISDAPVFVPIDTQGSLWYAYL